jgi:hypothetical protein
VGAAGVVVDALDALDALDGDVAVAGVVFAAGVFFVAGMVGGGVAELAAGVAVVEAAAGVAVARVGSAGSSVAIVTSYRMIDRNDHTWADWVCDMVYACFP